MNIANTIAKELKISIDQVQNSIKLLDNGNTVPFIARYRKEVTDGLDDVKLRIIEERLTYLRNLEKRKKEVYEFIKKQDKLTKDIIDKLDKAESLNVIEDIYRPFKSKKKTRAFKAKEKGLETLAKLIYEQREFDLYTEANKYINYDKEIYNQIDVLNGASDIIAEWISDNTEIRSIIRSAVLKGKIVSSKNESNDAGEDTVYEMYYNFEQEIKKIPSYRVLAINRGEKEEILNVKIIIYNTDQLLNKVRAYLFKKEHHIHFLEKVIKDSYKRLIKTSIEREIRNYLNEKAEKKAIKVFGKNLKNLFLQRPIKGKIVLGIDPGYRTGCKLAVVNENGNLLDMGVINILTKNIKKIEYENNIFLDYISKYNVSLISIGNGTASRETERFVADNLKKIKDKVEYIIVNEAGASVYSAGKTAQEEFPEIDVTIRGAISIARRAQDTMAELIKIDPKSLGIGQYQHDLNQNLLKKQLDSTLEDIVNTVGVDLNSASKNLLAKISGINSKIAGNIIDYRNKNGVFDKRNKLKMVKGLGPKTFEQCAGFLRISESKNILDNTGVHPESYEVAEQLLTDIGFENINKSINIVNLAKKYKVGIPTLNDIVKELRKPGRDPREELPKPLLREDVLDIKDLNEGMTLYGTVRNVCDFGAFVDIGVHQDGLIHISELSNDYIKDPYQVVEVGDIVKVKILNIDNIKNRISLKHL